MRGIANHILSFAAAGAEGRVFGAHELLQFGERAAVDQALKRLAAQGELMRIARGLYTRPETSRFGRRAPDPTLVTRDFGRREGLQIARHGAEEAHRLGLSTQVPARLVWLTSGRPATLSLEALVVVLTPAPKWLLIDPDGRAGALLRAADWLGAEAAPDHLAAIVPALTSAEASLLLNARGQMPGWMAQAVSLAVAHG